MRILLLLMCGTLACACINDQQTPRSEAEFRAQYKDLPPPLYNPVSGSLTGTGWLVAAVSVALVGAAIGWRVLNDRL